MGEAIGQMLPTAVVVALGPFQLVAVVLLLTTPGGRAKAVAFLAGWILGLAALSTIVLAASSGVGAEERGEPDTWVGVVQLGVGVVLVGLGVRSWRRRPRGEAAPGTPRWMASLDTLSSLRAFAGGVFVSSLNGKNTLLAIAAALAIAETGIAAGEQVLAYALFVAVGSAGVGTPVVATLVLGERARPPLDRLRAWTAANSAGITAVMFLVLGAMVLGDGISALAPA